MKKISVINRKLLKNLPRFFARVSRRRVVVKLGFSQQAAESRRGYTANQQRDGVQKIICTSEGSSQTASETETETHKERRRQRL